ncbi:LysR family transcriptional regulator [Polymorphum gilvum]|uniref:Probable transcriptional regulator n=1 Tax=Polymorphum gilvum (strain LMG 25793 / CGMCC 1.9160 / SL003B-26A1) TaxID=991905 RepID=F2J4L4_POLGS|nr:LysR family transcriptional regulator [Polymorphum gilvum]ADZ72266.1 Probable transcriptional regulator [Polymorphum gilvum SL003B-26A1]
MAAQLSAAFLPIRCAPSMSFTIRQLQYFVAAAEKGSVSGAAQSFSISQSSVTEAIKDLESDLGVALFERHSRGLTITHKGHQFLRHATEILASVSDARRAFSDVPSAVGGRLNLGVTSLVAGYVLSDILARFRRAYPAVEVTASEDNGDYLEHLLIGGELDVAVMVVSNLRDRMALQAEILEVSPYRLWLPLGHRLEKADSIALADIAGEPLIMLTLDEIEEATGKLLGALGSRPPVAFRTRSVEAVRSLVATGAGVAILPDLVYRPWSLEGDRIESRDVSGTLPVVQVGIVWRRGSAPKETTVNFINVAKAQRMLRNR